VSVMEIAAASGIRSEDWDRFEVPEQYRAEIVLGELVVTPSPTREHARAQVLLSDLFKPFLPSGVERLLGAEWRFDERGIVAHAPQPDLMFLPRSQPLTVTPLLAVEVLSPSDDDLLAVHRIPRIVAKRLDYARFGLRDYLEVDLRGPEPSVTRYELRDDALVAVDTAKGDEELVTDRPFRYSLRPSGLL
jgi:Uma2 family endonuclease